MNTSHTPGPWKVNENGWVIGANGETIVSHHPMTHLDETAQADARLIAAAPELLEIARRALEYAPNEIEANKCRAAIAKATKA